MRHVQRLACGTVAILLSVQLQAGFLDSISDVGAAALGATGVVDSQTAGAIFKGAKAVSKTFEDITPEQEYYIGRAVSATILDKYKPHSSKKLNEYVNLVGHGLLLSSESPESFKGYHFMVLDSDEVNAFATPGGFIYITEGLLKCCQNEDELAAVLAHEIGHVQLQHGMRSIKKSRISSALAVVATESAKAYSGQELAQLTAVFEESIQDVFNTMVVNGYSREYERDADEFAVKLMTKVGYAPHSIVAMLGEMKKRLKPGGVDFMKTHPSPDDRISEVSDMIASSTAKPDAVRTKRFGQSVN